MMKRHHLQATFVLALGFLSAPPLARSETESKPVKSNQVVAQLYSDRDAVVPGGNLNLIVSLKIDPGWHVYWRGPGEAPGAPTKISWELPDGLEAGRVQFPIPEEYYVKELAATSYVHSGTTLFIIPVHAKETLTGSDARIKVQVEWLVCKDICLPGDAEFSLTLPIAAKGAKSKPAHEELFKKATNALPQSNSEFLKLSHADVKPVKPGAEFTARLVVNIEPGHHMQSQKPFLKDLVAAKVFLEETPNFQLGEITFPKPHERTDPAIGKLSEFSGKIEIGIPVTVDGDADKSPRWIRGLLRAQVCSDKGTCFPPEHIEFAIPVQMEGGPVPVPEKRTAKTIATISAPSSESTPNWFIRMQDWLLARGFVGVIIAGILGGFLLNLMPCVLPVISLKVLSFVRQAQEDRGRIFRLSLTYAAGIMSFYGLLAYLWSAFGTGWGELFQNPIFVIAMSAVVLAFALSLFGVFSVFAPTVVGKLGEKAEGEGYSSAFFTGILATLLGTACTAPFLSAAVAYASRLPTIQGITVFLSVGFGMAFPFIVLGYNPAWVRFVPKPGAWFHTFEAVMGFLLLGTVVWLLNPLRGQLGDLGLLLSLIFLLSVAIAVWIKGKIGFGDPPARKLRLYMTALAVLALGWLLPFRWMSTIDTLIAEHVAEEDYVADGTLLKELLNDPEQGEKLSQLLIPRIDWSTANGIPWQPYRRARAMLAVRNGYTVFVDYTADWCASCKANLKSSIDREETIKVMKELNVIPYEADYTLKRPEITADLKKFGRAGVPMYLIYKPGDTDHPEVLPEFLTGPQMVIDALRRAGPSKVQPAAVDPDATADAAALEKSP